MCGIAGLWCHQGEVAPGNRATVARMVDALASRGPDGLGVAGSGPALLGHRRLSIIDLSEAAAQPISNEDGTVWLTYNGEIYNFGELRAELARAGHHFRSRGDGEVLVHGYEEWGAEGMAGRLRGMFAFALLDARRPALILGRDRLGIKPLYYRDDSRVFAFASEVRALAAAGYGEGVDAEAVAGLLLLGAVPEPRTIQRGIRCLPPAHLLTVEPTGSRIRPYWALTDPGPDLAGHDGRGLAEEIRGCLEETVARHLVSDVPLGVFLSGGVDSTALAVLARRAGATPLHTLTVTFDEPGFAEAAPARATATALGSEHHEILVTEADFRHQLPAFLDAMDQPTHDGLNTYLVAGAARKAGLTVALSGAGGDEVFWGYPHHARLAGSRRPLARLAAFPRPLRSVLTAAAWASGAVGGREGWRRLRALGPEVTPARLYLAVRGFFALEQVTRLTGLAPARLEALAEEALAGPPGVGWPGQAAMVNRLELRRYLHDQLLRDTDVFGMAHSLEIRVPYLDHELVELLWRVSPALKLQAGRNKPLLAAAVADPLTTERSLAAKRGFTLPLDRWIRGQAGELEALAVGSSGLDPVEVRRAWRAFGAGRLHWSRAWSLAALGAGRRVTW